MNIRFLGVGSAFTTREYYQSNMLLTAGNGKKMLIDCGTDIRFSLGECGITCNNLREEIDAVYISHLHADHIGGMEWLAFCTYFGKKPSSPRLFMEENLLEDLWNHCLKGGLGYIKGRVMDISDYFECVPVSENGSFTWENIGFTMVKMPHIDYGEDVKYSHGIVFGNEGKKVFISTDACLLPDTLAEVAGKTSIIFHDCETSTARTDVHAHYEDLRLLPEWIKRNIWLYHYQPAPVYIPEEDGFKGFVKKAQVFEL